MKSNCTIEWTDVARQLTQCWYRSSFLLHFSRSAIPFIGNRKSCSTNKTSINFDWNLYTSEKILFWKIETWIEWMFKEQITFRLSFWQLAKWFRAIQKERTQLIVAWGIHGSSFCWTVNCKCSTIFVLTE